MKKSLGSLFSDLYSSEQKATVLAILVTSLVLAAGHFWGASSPDIFRSVELGLAELSPAGESGGYAIPASGESDPACTATFEDRTNSSGQTYKALVVNWNRGDWTFVRSYQIARCSLATHGSPTGCNSAGAWWATPPWTRLYENHNYFSAGAGIGDGNSSLVVDSRSSNLANGQYFYRVNARFQSSGIHNAALNSGYQGSCGGTDNPCPQNYYTDTSYRDITCGAVLTVGDEVVPPPPSDLAVQLQIAKAGTSNWGSSVQIVNGEEVKLRWQTTNASSCVALPPTYNFGPTPANSGWLEDTSVDEPPTGQTYQYRISCSNSTGQSLVRSVSANKTSAISYPPPVITVNERYVRRGTNVRIDWDIRTNPPGDCVLSGPGLNITPVTPASGSMLQPIYSESTYRLECANSGASSVKVYVLPTIEET